MSSSSAHTPADWLRQERHTATDAALNVLTLALIARSFSWTRNGTHFDIDKDPKVTMKPHSGTLVIDISGGEKADAYEGVYQCTAHNELGTAVSNNIVIRQSSTSPLAQSDRSFLICHVSRLTLSLSLFCVVRHFQRHQRSDTRR